MGITLFARKNDEKDADEFWKNREKELGMPVIKKTLAQVQTEKNGVPIWGILYFTEKALYFQTFKSDNWLALILSSNSGKDGRTKDETVEIPFENLRKFELRPKKNGFFNRIFRQPDIVDMEWIKSPITEELAVMTFETEGNIAEFISLMPDN